MNSLRPMSSFSSWANYFLTSYLFTPRVVWQFVVCSHVEHLHSGVHWGEGDLGEVEEKSGKKPGLTFEN